MEAIRAVHASDLAPGPETPGMVRQHAQVTGEVTAVEVRTQPGAVSGWHHHGEHATYGYVISGQLRFEFGPGGAQSRELAAGDFFYVPPHTVHREGNPGKEEQVLVGMRVGEGPATVNVDGPEAG